MAYSKDLRKRVLRFLERGGKKTDAAERYTISERTVHVWAMQGPDHQPGKPGPTTSRKFDRAQLAKQVEDRPDALLKELAKPLGVSVNTVSHALRKMGIRRKKKR
jgi:transposase